MEEDGLAELVRTIGEQLKKGLLEGDDAFEGSEVFLSRERHVHCLEKALAHLKVGRGLANFGNCW